MPSPKSHRRGGNEKNKKGRLSEKASSFHGRDAGGVAEMLPRPRTVPDLLASRRGGGSSVEVAAQPPKLTKLLVNVTVQRSPGPVHVLVPLEATVKDLISAVLRQYVKEARRPVLPSAEGSAFDLHYSQFSLESLDKEEKLMELGSRNFFLCPRKTAAEGAAEGGGASVTSSCSEEAEKGIKKGLPWLKFMEFLL